jgi:hypothetical protein
MPWRGNLYDARADGIGAGRTDTDILLERQYSERLCGKRDAEC